jgi:hypothetical protein
MQRLGQIRHALVRRRVGSSKKIGNALNDPSALHPNAKMRARTTPPRPPADARNKHPTPLLETVPLIETVRIAATQRPQPDRHTLQICIRNDLSEHGRTDSLSLMFRHDVQVVQMPVVLLRPNQHKTHPNIIGFDEATQCRVKRRHEPLSRTLCVKAPNSLQALSHCGNANVHQEISIGLCSGRESQIHREANYAAPKGMMQHSRPPQLRAIYQRGRVQPSSREMQTDHITQPTAAKIHRP